jgi:DNA-binding MarR family transcriptional regulator
MLNEKGLKEAFEKIKVDIFSLNSEISDLKTELFELKNTINNLNLNPTHPQINPTHPDTPTHNPTHPLEVRGLKYPNLGISTGNRGVPTDKQTNQQTDNPTHFYSKNEDLNQEKTLNEQINNAQDLLDSLDNLRKEIRLKFKSITNQEMLVFSTIYQLEQIYPEGVEYTQIAQKLKLSPSSIRDYVLRLISKGIPILKEKVNNKTILLRISPELKKIATLDTIIKLREL